MKKPDSWNHFGWKGPLRCVHAAADEGKFLHRHQSNTNASMDYFHICGKQVF